jgi:hypothetical protein
VPPTLAQTLILRWVVEGSSLARNWTGSSNRELGYITEHLFS